MRFCTALVDIRHLTRVGGATAVRQIEELSDLTHELPRFVLGRDDFAVTGLREGFLAYARQYWPHSDPDKTFYVEVLDMDEAAFAERFRRTEWAWPEPVATAS